MTTASGRKFDDGGTFVTNEDPPDDDSDITPTNDRNARAHERKREEKTIRFRFAPTDQGFHDINPSMIHLHWIASIQETFGDKVHIIDNNNHVLPKVDILRWTPHQHQQHYKVHQWTPTDYSSSQDNVRFKTSTKGQAQFIVHRIRTTIALCEMMNVPKVKKLLVDHSCYLHEHRWTENVWNTTLFGFMVGIDPQFYDVDQTTMKLNTEINQMCPRTKVPPFRLVFSAPQLRTEKFQAITKAYAIETEKHDSLTMMKILKKTYQDSAAFTSFQLKSRHPEAHTRIIHQQSRILASHHVIILQNIGPDAMFYLIDHIQALDGVLDVIPSKTVAFNGNYRILVNKDQFRTVRRTLLKNLSSLYAEHVPSEAQPRERRYPDEPMVAHLYEDG